MMELVTGKYVPDVSAEQRALDRTRKQLCKLRWIGREADAQRMLVVLRDAGKRSPARGERGQTVPRLVSAEDSIA
jgi:hypothetical protein